MATSNECHVKTDVITLGYNNLFKPRAYQTAGAKKGEKAEESRPTFSLNIALDKKTDREQIMRILAGQKAAVAIATEEGEWDDTQSGSFAFRDADKAKVQTSATDKRKIVLSEKRPKLKGKFVLTAKAPANRPPEVCYLDRNGMPRRMPKPILNPDPEDKEQVAEANRRADFWNKMVFEGQYAVVTVTFSVWTMETSQGVRARIDNVLIIGGGTPAGTVNWSDDFAKDDLTKLIAWRKKFTPDYQPDEDPWNKDDAKASDEPRFDDEDTGVTASTAKDDEPEFDETTGEITDDVEETPKPRRARRTQSSRRKLQPVDDEPAEPAEDEFDDMAF